MIDYPEYNPDLPGYICSGCGRITEQNYDDKGVDRVAPICKDCREMWDAITKRELETIAVPVPAIKTLTFEPLSYPFLNEIKKIRENTTVENKELTDIARQYVDDKHYEDINLGIDYINNWVEVSKFKNVIIIWKWIRNNQQYNEFKDLFKNEITYTYLRSDVPLQYGLAKSEIGLLLVAKLG